MLLKLKNLFQQVGFQRYFKNTSWLLGEKILRIIVALFIGVWVARYLGPHNFGILSYAQSFVAIFAAFSSLGLSSILDRDLVKYPDKTEVLLGTTFVLQTVGSTALMGCLFISIYLNDNSELTNKIIVILGLLTFLGSFNVISTYFNSIVKSRLMVIPSVIGLAISALLKVALILNESPLMHFVYVLAFDILFLTLGKFYFYFKDGKSIFKWNFSRKEALGLLRDSWPLILSGIIVSIYMKIDQVMIKEFLGNNEVGQYSAAVRLSEAWYFVPSVICGSLFPAIVNAKMKSPELYRDRLQKLYNLMVILALSVGVPTALLSDWLVKITYGPEYYQTAQVLSVHVMAGVFVFLGIANSKWFLNENLQRYSMVCLGIGMVANITLNFFLIPVLGPVGAAYATLISQFVATMLSPLIFKKTRPSVRNMVRALFFVDLIKRKY